MDSWERFDDTASRSKKSFSGSINIGDITDANYIHAQTVFEGFKIKDLGEYHDLYVKSDTSLLADVF